VLHRRTRKSEIYSVGNYDMMFDADKHWGIGYRKTHESILDFAIGLHTLTQYIVPHSDKYSIN